MKMTKKTINPKVLIHLTISPDIKKWMIEHNINASELLENSVKELINVTGDSIDQNNDEFYNALKEKLRESFLFTTKFQFSDPLLKQENSVIIINMLRTKYGLSLDLSKKFLDRYIKEQEKIIFENDLKKEIKQ